MQYINIFHLFVRMCYSNSFLFCVLAGIPLVIVSLVLAIDKDAYGGIVPEDSEVMLQSTDAL